MVGEQEEMTMLQIHVGAKKYTVVDSVIATDKYEPVVRAAFARRGIVDYVNAAPPRSRKCAQFFIMLDGTAKAADTRITSVVIAEVKKELKLS